MTRPTTGAAGQVPLRPCGGRVHRRAAAAVLASLLLAALAGCSAEPQPGPAPHHRAPSSSTPTASPRGGTSAADSGTRPAASPSSHGARRRDRAEAAVAPPVRIRIPAIRIDRTLVGLRVDRVHHALEAPSDYRDIGWWNDGPAPGGPGAAVLAGHVDTATGPAVFTRLYQLHRGAHIRIDRADGTTVRFTVTRVRTYGVHDFPDRSVYRLTGPSELRLLTCTGPYDRSAGRYTQNLVVFADLVRSHHRRSTA